MTPPRRLAVAVVLAFSACGYSAGSLAPERHRRVHVPVFENDTFWRGLEVALTRRVAEELAARPGFFIVPRDQADIVLAGTIQDFQSRVLSEDRDDQSVELSAHTTVRVRILDARDPGKVLETYSVADRAGFFLARGETLGTARDESFADLARRIVNGLEQEFPRGKSR